MVVEAIMHIATSPFMIQSGNNTISNCSPLDPWESPETVSSKLPCFLCSQCQIWADFGVFGMKKKDPNMTIHTLIGHYGSKAQCYQCVSAIAVHWIHGKVQKLSPIYHAFCGAVSLQDLGWFWGDWDEKRVKAKTCPASH